MASSTTPTITGRTRIYDLLAELLRYPSDVFTSALAECVAALRHDAALARVAESVAGFHEAVGPLDDAEREELYTRTFDINPVCSLEVGWQMFGESYGRGTFLVAMRRLLVEVGLTESGELPDHLTHVLAALPRMKDGEAVGLASAFVVPAIDRMLKAMAGKNVGYAHLLTAARDVVSLDYVD